MNKIVMSMITFGLLANSLNAIECKKKSEDLKSVEELTQNCPITSKKDSSMVDGIDSMFEEGDVSGQLRAVYVQNKFATETATEIDTYATAAGGFLKYETAKYGGVNFGFSMIYTEDINALSGDTATGDRSDELSSSNAKYSQLSEAYIAYEGCLFDFTLGRQTIDTPLADSDDIRMVPNSFEAFVMNYPSETFNLTLGYLNRWQGTDAGLDDGWIKTGENGTSFVGATYEGGVEASLWYYNITEQNSAIYADLAYTLEFSENASLTAAVQYLSESEINNSGVEANIYGASVELALSDLTLAFNYNASSEEVGKTSFSGFGGGTLYTNMDTMILDEITADREASSYVGGVSYALGNFSLIYAYGNFEGEADSLGDEAHIIEQDMGIEYNYNDKLVAYIMYVISEDELSQVDTDNDWTRTQVLLSYNF